MLVWLDLQLKLNRKIGLWEGEILNIKKIKMSLHFILHSYYLKPLLLDFEFPALKTKSYKDNLNLATSDSHICY